MPIAHRPPRRRAARVPPAPLAAVVAVAVTAESLHAAGNSGSGIVLATPASVDADGLTAAGNDGVGIALFGSDATRLRLTSSSADANKTGIALLGAEVVLDDCTATASGPAGGDPSDGSAYGVASRPAAAAVSSLWGARRESAA
jgi:hypothetical protein